MSEEQPLLLNPGPVNVSDRVRAALVGPDICHREPELAELLAGTRQALLTGVRAEGTHDPVFFTGSGTAALEAATIASVRQDRKLAVIDNGVYGARMRTIAEVHGIETVPVVSHWTERPDAGAVAAALEDPEVDALGFVHHETTTGLLNPAGEWASLARRAGKRVLVDTISGLGGEPIDLASCDLAVCTANKCLGGLPGVSFVLVGGDASSWLEEVPRRSVYLDLRSHLEAQREGGTPFTPGIPALRALKAALEELIEEGLDERIARFERAADLLRRGFEQLGLRRLLHDDLLSNTITALYLPEGRTYASLHDELRARGFVIYAGQGKLSEQIFRIANMGQVPLEAYERFLEALREVLR